MLPFALVLSGAIHAAVIGISHDVVPELTADPAVVYATQLDAVLIDIAQDKGETPLPSQPAAAAESSRNWKDLNNFPLQRTTARGRIHKIR